MKTGDVLRNFGVERAAGYSQQGFFKKCGRLFFRSEEAGFQLLAIAQFA